MAGPAVRRSCSSAPAPREVCHRRPSSSSAPLLPLLFLGPHNPPARTTSPHPSPNLTPAPGTSCSVLLFFLLRGAAGVGGGSGGVCAGRRVAREGGAPPTFCCFIVQRLIERGWGMNYVSSFFWGRMQSRGDSTFSATSNKLAPDLMLTFLCFLKEKSPST